MKRSITREYDSKFSISVLSCMFFAITLTVALVGCGSSENPDLGELDGGIEPEIVQTDSEANPERRASSPVEELRELTLLARKLESEERFPEAINVWTEIVGKLQAEYGEDSWQAKNAILAWQTSKQQTELDPEQRATLTELTKLQKQIRSANEAGQVASAVQGAGQVVEKTAELFGPDSAVTAKQRRLYGQLLRRHGEIPKAIWQYEKAAEDLRKYFKTAHPEVCNLHDELGQIYLETNQLNGAVEHLRIATGLAGKIWGDDSMQYAKRANQLGVGCYRNGDLEKALTVLLAAEVIRRKAKGEASLEVAHSRLNIGTVWIELKQYPQAAEKLLAAHKTFRDSKLTALEHQTGRKLATAYMLNRQPEEAEKFLAQEVAYLESLGKENDPELADARYRLAISLGRQAEYQRAEPVIKSALAVNESQFGPNHSRTVKCYQAYSMMLQRLDRMAEAQDLMSRLRVAQSDVNSKTFR